MTWEPCTPAAPGMVVVCAYRPDRPCYSTGHTVSLTAWLSLKYRAHVVAHIEAAYRRAFATDPTAVYVAGAW